MNLRCLSWLLTFLCVATRVWSQAANDGFDQRIALAGRAVTAVSDLRTATHEIGEPNHANNSGARSLWWTWTAPVTGTVNFSTFGGGATPSRVYSFAGMRALAIYTGDTLTSLSEVASVGNISVVPLSKAVPAGLSCNVQVTAGTVYQIVVDGPSRLDYPDEGTVALAINQSPTIYSAAGAGGTAGGSFAYTILASNNPTGFGSPDLPAPLILNSSTGEITGVLPAAGTYVVHVTATNPGGTGTGTLNLVVTAASTAGPLAPVITGNAAATGFVGAPFSYYPYASNSARRFTADNLPPGLSLDAASGTISGTPTTAGLFNVLITATNAVGTGSATVAINIIATPRRPVITNSLSVSGTVGSSLSYNVNVSDTSDAGKPNGYTAGNLPPGLGFDPNTGFIQGAPATAGVWSVPVSASNAGGTGNAVVTVRVAAAAVSTVGAPSAPPVLNSSAVANGSVGGAFSYRLAATNAPTAFAIDNLPPGLSLNNADGYITGTPTAAGVYGVPVSASNAYGESHGTLTINILATAPGSTTYPPLVISSAAEVAGYVGQSLSYAVYALVPGYGSYYSSSATVTASGLPPGMVAGSTYGYPVISGTPTTAGTYAATVTATPAPNSYPPARAGSATVTFVIATGSAPGPVAPPVITSAAEIALRVGVNYSSASFLAASNTPTAYTASGLPSSLTYNASNGSITGTPTTAGTYPVAVTATNAVGTGSATVAVVVAAAPPTTAPGITSYATASGAVGSPFTYNIITYNTATNYAVGSLPPGLTQNVSTISGTPTQAGVFMVPISVSNAGGTTTATLTLTIASGPSSPVILSNATVRGSPGLSLSYPISASNSPGGYTADNLPPGLSLDAASGTISGTPTQLGVWNVPITATNAVGTGSATVTFTIAKLEVPTFYGVAAASGTVGSAFSFSLSAGGYVTSYTADNLPPGLAITASNGYVSGTPTQAGTWSVPVTAANSGGTTSATLTISIAGPASASVPIVSSAAASRGTVGGAFSYRITASGSPTSYDLGATPPPGLSFTPATGILSGTPTAAGTYLVPVSATNGAGTGQAKVTLIFAAQPPAPPVITSPAMFTANTTDSVYYPVTATNFPTSYAASGLPAGLSINSATGVISGALVNTNTATFPVVITATNSVGPGTATVVVVNGGPATGRITSALSANGVTGSAFSHAITTNNTNYSFSASNLPPGLSLNTSTGVISGTPTINGSIVTTVSVSTANGTATGKITFSFAPSASSKPVLAGSAGANAAVGDAFTHFLTFGNAPTSTSVTNLPAGLSYDPARGLISGSPTTSGTYGVGVSATNGAGTTSGTLTIVVVATYNNSAKIVSAAGASATVGTAFTYTAVTNQPTTYGSSVTNLPSGLSYDANTLKFTGTPTAAGVYTCKLNVSTPQGPTTGYLTVAVDNGTGVPPVFGGSAAVAGAYGAAFSYALSATGTSPTYTASGLPAGLSLDPISGTIAGTPTAVGTFFVPVTAANAAGTGSATVTIVVAAAAPSLNTASLGVTATLGTPANVYRIPGTNGATSYAASGLPPGLSLNPISGVISGTPTVKGVFQTAISAANAYGSANAVIAITVKDYAAAPTFYSFAANLSGRIGASFSNSLTASSNSAVTYAASGLPPGLFLNSVTGLIFGAPTVAGRYPVTLTAMNAYGSDTAAVTLLIAASPAQPTLPSAPAAIPGTTGVSFNTSFSVSNATGCAVSGLPPGLSYTFSSGYLYLLGTPTAAGIYPVTITGSNTAGTGSAVVTLNIDGGPPAAPVISSAAGASGSVGTAFQYNVTASNTPTAYGASGLPDGLRFDPVTGAISGTPTTSGSYPIPITATNAGGTVNAVVTLQINAVTPAANAAPVISSAAAVYFSGANTGYAYFYSATTTGFAYTIAASNTPTSFAADSLPPGLVLNPVTGQITGRPLASGTFTVPIRATNAVGTGNAALTIIAPVALPTLSSPLVAIGRVSGPLTYAASPSAAYYDPGYATGVEPTNFTASGLPPGLSINTATSVIAGTPAQAGTFLVTITATNRAGSTTEVVTFVIGSGPAAPPLGTAPVISGNAVATGYVGVPLNTSVSGGTSYAASGLPDGLGLNPATGAITGTPTTAGVYTVPINVANPYGTSGATLTIDIAAAPAPPSILSGAGASATAGVSFGYSIYTNSTDGVVWPATAYGASGLPPGLSLNSLNGYLSGTPTAAGSYTIPISATAGGVTGNATLTLNVLPATAPNPFTPTSAGLTGTLGFVGVPFNSSLGTAGFTPDSTLPDGLTYDDASGVLTGLPMTAGNFDLTFSRSGTGGAAAGRSALNLRIILPDLSLPRITNQPGGGSVAQGGGVTLAAAVFGVPMPAFQWMRDSVSVPGATGSVLRLDAAQPADTGTYMLVAVNSSGRAVSGGAFLLVTQTYGNWQTLHFSTAEIAAGLAADGYDFNADGLPNLLEYALDRDPRTGHVSVPPAGNRSDSGNLQVQFSRDVGKTDLLYTVEASSDLLTWTPIARSTAGAATVTLDGAAIVSEIASGAGLRTVTVQDGPGTGAGMKRFLHLRVDRQ